MLLYKDTESSVDTLAPLETIATLSCLRDGADQLMDSIRSTGVASVEVHYVKTRSGYSCR